MNDSNDEPKPETSNRAGPNLFHGMVLRMIIVVGLLLATRIAQLALTGVGIEKLQSKSAAINLAGRQRMLVLQAALLSKQLADAADDPQRDALRRKLREVDQQLDDAQTAMLRGDSALGIPSASSTILAIYEGEPYQLQLRMRQFREALPIRQESSQIGQAEIAAELQAGLEAIVTAYEDELKASVQTLQIARIAVFVFTVGVLAVAGLAVFWPLLQRIRAESQRRDAQAKQLSVTLDQLREQRDDRQQRMRAMASVMEDLQDERAALEREIMARENVQQALQRSEEVFHAIVESAPTAVVMIDPFGNIALVNGETERLFGYNRKELVGKPVEILVPQRFQAEHPHYRRQFLDNPTTRRMGAGRDLYGIRKDGTEVPVEIGLNPIEAEEGIFVLSAIVDITERQRTEREIRRINAELLKKNEEIQQFVYTVSHDLKSPLVTCKGFVGVAREDLKEGHFEDVESSLDRVEHATDRMGQLIQDLLQLSRIGTIRNEPEEIDVGQLVRSALSDLSARIDEVNAVVSVQHDLPRVIADRVRLTQVFENLLTNAVKYGCRTDRPEIAIEGYADADEVRYCVRDNGIGIAPRFHERIFGLFERLDTDRDGTGVGLAAVARIMDAHGGRTWVESDVGKGAAFWLAFPATPHIDRAEKLEPSLEPWS